MRHKVCALLAVAIFSCSSEPLPPANPTPDPTQPVVSAARGNLRFKGPERLNNDLAAALELDPQTVCTELGMYQCTALVHTVSLGGVEPYGAGLYESTGTAVATPLVVERLAWSACTQRVNTDLANPGAAVLFGGVPLNGGKLVDAAGEPVRAVIGALTQRALQRDPYEREMTRYTKLARDIEASGAAEPARAFFQALCFAVLSSTESVFY